MAQELGYQLKGLQTNPSPEVASEGSLIRAQNVNIDSPSTITSRRGFNVFGNLTFGIIEQISQFDDRLHLFSNTGQLQYDSTGAGVWVLYAGTYIVPDSRIGYRTLEYNDNFYFTTTLGVNKVESVSGGTIALAGIPRAIDGTGVDVAPAGAGWLLNGDSVAYRVVWGKNYGNGVISLGAPSERIEVTNGGGATRDVDLTFSIPDGIDGTYFYQIYRSASVTGTPNDELGLIVEAVPTAGEITAGAITITDITPDTLRGATIYTAQTQQGILNANLAPPFAKDIALYKDTTMYANTRIKHSVELTLLGAGALSAGGIQNGDTLTIGGVTLTGAAVENIGLDQFLVSNTGVPGTDIALTAQSIVRVLNQSASNTDFYGYYTSGFNDLPGSMLFERRTLLDTSFTVSYTGANASAWSPDLTNSITSTNETKPNRIYFSKQFQPEAVPILNFIDVGTDDSEILRIIPLKNSVFVFKDDGEVYQIRGETFINFQVDLFDSNTTLYAPKTAVSFNNQVWLFSDQGIISVGDAGVKIRSWDIENQVRPYLSNTNFPDFPSDAWAVSYDSDRKYIFSDRTTWYVYNILTNSWTTWAFQLPNNSTATIPFAMLKRDDDKLYYCDQFNKISQERKNFDSTDFTDTEDPVTITSVNNPANQVDLASPISTDNIGRELVQSGTTRQIIAVSGATITLESQAVWVTGAASIFNPINCIIKTNDLFSGNYDQIKRYRELYLGFRDLNREYTVRFFNNFHPQGSGNDEVVLTPTLPGAQWGSGTWGGFPWGGATAGAQGNRTYFPQEQQRALSVNIEVETNRSFTAFSLNKLALTFEVASERFPS